jgi:hypothetical protein
MILVRLKRGTRPTIMCGVWKGVFHPFQLKEFFYSIKMTREIERIPPEFEFVGDGESFREYHINPRTGEFIYTQFFGDSEVFDNMELAFKAIGGEISFDDGSKYLHGEEAKQKIRELCAVIIETYNIDHSAKPARFKK